MHRKTAMRLGATAALLAAGLAAALAITQTANAYRISDLPGMGFGVLLINLSDGCHQYKVSWHNDPKTDLGSDCAPDFQTKLDAFMASHCPPYVCPENAPTTVTTTSTETDVYVTTAEPLTTTVTSLVVAPPAPDDDPPDVDAPPPAPPTASFTATDDGLIVTASDLNGNGNVVWMFGDGANDAGASASHRYAKAGRYVIVETVVDGNGLVAQATETVSVSLSRTEMVG